MAKQQTEDELNLKRKARRRLIGAIALTLAVVVILPMVLDSEPKPTGQDIDLRIPAPDKVGEFVPGVAASEVAEVVTLAGSAVAPTSAPVAVSATSAVAEVATAVVAPVAAAVVPAASNPKQEVTGKVQPSAIKPVEAKLAEATLPEPKTPERKILEPKAAESKIVESKSATKVAGAESYVAQIGAYSNADTAKREADKLKKWGFKAYTEKVGDKIRVRVGPYAERDKADKVRKLLEKHGLHPAVVSVK